MGPAAAVAVAERVLRGANGLIIGEFIFGVTVGLTVGLSVGLTGAASEPARARRG